MALFGELTALFASVRSNPSRLAELGFDLSDAIRKLPAELKDTARYEDEEWIQSVLGEAESLLLSRLWGPGADV